LNEGLGDQRRRLDGGHDRRADLDAVSVVGLPVDTEAKADQVGTLPTKGYAPVLATASLARRRQRLSPATAPAAGQAKRGVHQVGSERQVQGARSALSCCRD